MRFPIIISMLLSCPILCAQIDWEWELLPFMPEAVSNNAVSQGYSGDTLCMYSFTGIASGLEPDDIHLKSFRYNTITEEWQQLPDVDDFRGKIAAGASTVDNVIYIIGGYHVFPDLSETTSPKVHRFDPEANTWLEDGADIPTPVDDHVQVVWRDSLIYTVSGWSQNTNVSDVQIYNPAEDSWTAATPVPANNNFRHFGGSGTIIGDTIYYYGGTQISGFSFNATPLMRKGVINPDDPTQVEWELLDNCPFGNGYRMAATSYQNRAVWIGGAATSYNFDGLAYSNGAGVEPIPEIRSYDPESFIWNSTMPTPFQVMDLRGIARESGNSWIIAGGMATNQQVSNAAYRITRTPVSVKEHKQLPFSVAQSGSQFRLKFEQTLRGKLEVYSLKGIRLIQKPFSGNSVFTDLANRPAGLYVLKVQTAEGLAIKKVINP
jgi:N-acetylneuraminic acid mutarotase